MNQYAIIVDSSSGLTKDLRERFSIDDQVVGFVLYPDGTSVLSDTDWANVKPEQYFESMSKDKMIYGSSAANVTTIEEVYRRHLDQGQDILALTLSSALSAMYNNSMSVKEKLEKEYPERKIFVVDTLRFATAAGILGVKASENRANGMGIEENANWLMANRNRVHEAGPMDDLHFLARKGRINKAAAFFGTMAGVKPMGDFNGKGLTEVIVKAKGYKKAMEMALDYLKATIENPEEQIIFVSHSLREKQAEAYKQAILEAIHPKEVIVGWVDMTSGANMGPGLCAAFYFGKPISEDMSEEKALMTELSK
ncbi:MAG: DegV family protein [Bacilli bacterium]|nr:DegV family protein [Bacilli bacterium]